VGGQRKRYSADLKAKIAEDSIKAHKTANEIAAEYGVHPTQIAQWKRQALDGLPTLFSTRASDQAKSEEELIATLYQQIGQLKVQVDWLEKKSKALHS
jgi:transposase-like protein